jgi:hypothetical protein
MLLCSLIGRPSATRNFSRLVSRRSDVCSTAPFLAKSPSHQHPFRRPRSMTHEGSPKRRIAVTQALPPFRSHHSRQRRNRRGTGRARRAGQGVLEEGHHPAETWPKCQKVGRRRVWPCPNQSIRRLLRQPEDLAGSERAALTNFIPANASGLEGWRYPSEGCILFSFDIERKGR